MSDRFKLYDIGLSPNCLRVRAVANELEIPLELVPMSFRGGELENDNFLALNPNGKVPVLEHNGVILWESRAINNYLASCAPKSGLYPEDARLRAKIDQWSYWQAIHLGPAMQKVAFERFIKGKFGMGATDEAAIAREVDQIPGLLQVLDSALRAQDWVCGALSVADFALASTFMYRKQASISLEAVPGVSSWIERMESRPSWQSAMKPIREGMA